MLDGGEQGRAEPPVLYGLLETGPWQLHLCGFIFMTPKHWDGEEKDGPIFQMFCYLPANIKMFLGKVTTMNLKHSWLGRR